MPPSWGLWLVQKAADAVTYEVYRRRGAPPPPSQCAPAVVDAMVATLRPEGRANPRAALTSLAVPSLPAD